MSVDWKSILESFAPTAASLVVGPMGGQVVTDLEGILGLTPGAGEAAVQAKFDAKAVTPDQVAAIRAKDQDYQVQLKTLELEATVGQLKHQETEDTLTVQDTADARKNNSGNQQIFVIAIVILITFAVVMGGVLYGCWLILGNGLSIKDVTVVAAVSGLVGSIVGYVAANAQTVINYLYGGSLGGHKSSEALAASVSQMGTALGKAAQT